MRLGGVSAVHGSHTVTSILIMTEPSFARVSHNPQKKYPALPPPPYLPYPNPAPNHGSVNGFPGTSIGTGTTPSNTFISGTPSFGTTGPPLSVCPRLFAGTGRI